MGFAGFAPGRPRHPTDPTSQSRSSVSSNPGRARTPPTPISDSGQVRGASSLSDCGANEIYQGVVVMGERKSAKHASISGIRSRHFSHAMPTAFLGSGPGLQRGIQPSSHDRSSAYHLSISHLGNTKQSANTISSRLPPDRAGRARPAFRTRRTRSTSFVYYVKHRKPGTETRQPCQAAASCITVTPKYTLNVCTKRKRVERDTAASHCMAARCVPLQGANATNPMGAGRLRNKNPRHEVSRPHMFEAGSHARTSPIRITQFTVPI